MTTGLQLVLLRLTTLNCEQSQMASVRPTMLVWRTYIKYMSSLTPLNDGRVSSLRTTLIAIHLQSVGALALTPPK
jgi:hypothetical protein